MAYIGAATAVIGLVSTGISFYGQQQAVRNQEAIANYNYEIEKQNAAVAARSAQLQASWRAQHAANEQQNQLNNAAALEAQARAAEVQGLATARRMREENEGRLALMRNRYAKSGVTTEGSPLSVMARSAGLLELAVQDEAYKSEMEARAYDRKAAGERYQAGYSLFDKQVAEYEHAAASVGHSLNLERAKLGLMSAQTTASANNISSYGSLLSGVGNSITSGINMYTSYTAKKDSGTPRT